MALILVEEFRRYQASADISATNDDLTTVWAKDVNIAVSAGNGRFGAQCIQNNSNSNTLTIRLGSGVVSGSTLIVGAELKISPSVNGAADSNSMFFIRTSAGSQHARINYTAGGYLTVWNASDAYVGVTTQPMSFDVWHYVEFKFSLLDAGSVTIRLDGVEVLASTSGDFRSGTGNTSNIEQVIIGGRVLTYWGDMIIMDGSGATFNDFMGDMRYELQLPDADGATANWTASGGSNFQCIDDAIPLASANFDTDYISEGTTDDLNYVSHAAVSATNYSTIHFVGVYALARADAAGDKIAGLALSSGSTSTGADQALVNGTYRWRKYVVQLDPNGSIAWTPTNINAAEFGVKKRV